jgi:PAS domain S-box-containing protein
MSDPIKVLLVEDIAEAAVLLIREMRKGGLEIVAHRVDTRDELAQALEQFEPDVILSDYALPGFGGMTALQMAMHYRPDTPFIFVSGTIGEERAIEAVRQGATDYVLKDNHARLVPAIRRALTEAGERRARRRAELEREESEQRFRLFMQQLPGAAYIKDLEGRFNYVNPGTERVLGKKAHAIIGHSTQELFPAPYAERYLSHHRVALESRRGISTTEEVPTADGVRCFHIQRFPIFDREGNPVLVGGIALDVTERIDAERAQRESATLMNAITASALDCIIVIDDQGRIREFNPAAERMFGHMRDAARQADGRADRSDPFSGRASARVRALSCERRRPYPGQAHRDDGDARRSRRIPHRTGGDTDHVAGHADVRWSYSRHFRTQEGRATAYLSRPLRCPDRLAQSESIPGTACACVDARQAKRMHAGADVSRPRPVQGDQ